MVFRIQSQRGINDYDSVSLGFLNLTYPIPNPLQDGLFTLGTLCSDYH